MNFEKWLSVEEIANHFTLSFLKMISFLQDLMGTRIWWVNMLLPLPGQKKQKRISHQAKNSMQASLQLLNILEENLKKSNPLKQSILKKAFEGEL